MRLSTGFMNEVTSRFVPPLCSRQDNKVSGAAPQTQKLRWVPEAVDWDMLADTEIRVEKGLVDVTPAPPA